MDSASDLGEGFVEEACGFVDVGLGGVEQGCETKNVTAEAAFADEQPILPDSFPAVTNCAGVVIKECSRELDPAEWTTESAIGRVQEYAVGYDRDFHIVSHLTSAL